jgi:hypothetical protein
MKGFPPTAHYKSHAVGFLFFSYFMNCNSSSSSLTFNEESALSRFDATLSTASPAPLVVVVVVVIVQEKNGY